MYNKTIMKNKQSKQPKLVIPTDDEIRQRAYELAQARHFEPGNELADWFQAEQELKQALASISQEQPS